MKKFKEHFSGRVRLAVRHAVRHAVRYAVRHAVRHALRCLRIIYFQGFFAQKTDPKLKSL